MYSLTENQFNRIKNFLNKSDPDLIREVKTQEVTGNTEVYVVTSVDCFEGANYSIDKIFYNEEEAYAYANKQPASPDVRPFSVEN